MNVVILAAGKGTRMKSDLPKVLHAVAGKPMVEHVLQAALQLGATRVVAVLGHGAERVQDALKAYAQDGKLSFAMQTEQLGTGHAVLQALPALNPAEPTLVMYGDVPLTSVDTLKRLLAAAAKDALPVLTVELADAGQYGRIVRSADGQIERIVEFTEARNDAALMQLREINTGIMVLPPERAGHWLRALKPANAKGEFYLTDLVEMARRDGFKTPAVLAPNEAEVEGVHSKVELARVERVYQLRQAHALLTQGVELADPARFDLRGELTCEADVRIDINCIFEGRVHLGAGVQVGPGCVLKDVRVDAGAVIKAYTFADGEGETIEIGPSAQVGPFARLRSATKLGAKSRVGNFVEVKKSSFAEGAKANHLAYVGDAQVGARVNIGAGCITANYDGVNKFKTTIEDDAFIGSNSVLVAPVTIAQGSFVAAGSAINKNTEAEALTIARAKQQTLKGWKRPKKA
jgi:bifunctional UDP-N-acetylglucosamine pyrophosphorylase / glucosamine-1-phosphate N-acetyltransferase